MRMYPKADVPVLQLSLDYMLPPERMFKLGKELGRFRKEGVLIIGSGNLVHNLMMIRPGGRPFQWALDFDSFVERSLYKRDYEALIEYTKHPSAQIAHPTNDHYLPLIYSVGAAGDDESYQFNEGIVFGSVSMRCAAFGLE